MDWHGNRHNEKFTYKEVSWETWEEGGEYAEITDGSVELSASSEYKVSGSFAFEGREAPNTNDLLRIYYSFADDSGERISEPIATLFLEHASVDHAALFRGSARDGIKSSGSADGVSVLSVLKNKQYGRPYIIKKNTNAIFKAQEMITDCGLNVAYDPSPVVLSADHTFDSNATYLDMVMWLCEVARYHEPFPDAYGTVQLRPAKWYDKTVLFANDDKSIMYPQISVQNDWQKTCNTVRLYLNTDKAAAYAIARNIRGSKASLENRGNREMTYQENVSEVDTSESLLTGLMNLAVSKLEEISPDIEYVTFEHAYIPLLPFDKVNISYSDMEWEGTADVISIALSPSVKTRTRVKNVLTDSIEIEVTGEVLR